MLYGNFLGNKYLLATTSMMYNTSDQILKAYLKNTVNTVQLAAARKSRSDLRSSTSDFHGSRPSLVSVRFHTLVRPRGTHCLLTFATFLTLTLSVEPYKQYNTLPVPDLHVYQLLLLVHRFLYHKHKLPEVFSEYFALNRSIHNYTTRTRYDLHPRTFQVHIPHVKIIKFKASQLWNELLTQLKTIRYPNTFKYKLKSYLINKLNNK